MSRRVARRRLGAVAAAGALQISILISTPPVGAEQRPAVHLRDIDVQGTDEALVVTLTADGPIDGRLQQAPGGTTRLYVDLRGVRPQVPALTPVNRGPVLRIRVALNSADPLITRVVLDVSNAPTARIERGESEHQLRIVVGESIGPAAPGRTEPEAAAPPSTIESQWCGEVADRLSALLDDSAPSTSQPAMLAAVSAWDALERDVAARKVSQPLQPVHFMLLQAVRLGRIAATYRNARDFEQAAAAQSGARLLLNTARDRLEQLK
jgi:hypothetical protein